MCFNNGHAFIALRRFHYHRLPPFISPKAYSHEEFKKSSSKEKGSFDGASRNYDVQFMLNVQLAAFALVRAEALSLDQDFLVRHGFTSQSF
ncbi:unnamed protein product [Nezara viridula]|uniref:Uncharacterized protein n=1 Tax=Nezara viridula TaxID=85310 RepID=A0A9P0H4K9_NEZVI|nr:unnamed protein product [Nezara viridula]